MEPEQHSPDFPDPNYDLNIVIEASVTGVRMSPKVLLQLVCFRICLVFAIVLHGLHQYGRDALRQLSRATSRNFVSASICLIWVQSNQKKSSKFKTVEAWTRLSSSAVCNSRLDFLKTLATNLMTRSVSWHCWSCLVRFRTSTSSSYTKYITQTHWETCDVWGSPELSPPQTHHDPPRDLARPRLHNSPH